MEGSFSNKQRVIQATSDVFWTMQLTKDIPKNDEQYFLGITPQGSVGKLYGQFCDTSQDNGRTGRKDNQVFENCRETQLVF